MTPLTIRIYIVVFLQVLYACQVNRQLTLVLDAENHDYIFFCAKPGYNGAHAFAKTNARHAKNARVYHRWLDREGIR